MVTAVSSDSYTRITVHLHADDISVINTDDFSDMVLQASEHTRACRLKT